MIVYTMIVYTMIVDESPSALRRPGQAFGLPNHYTISSAKRESEFG